LGYRREKDFGEDFKNVSIITTKLDIEDKDLRLLERLILD
jgi:hypothetical protein